jgi:hypothetical protein
MTVVLKLEVQGQSRDPLTFFSILNTGPSLPPPPAHEMVIYIYQTRLKVTDSDKHSNLFLYGINYGLKKFYDRALRLEMFYTNYKVKRFMAKPPGFWRAFCPQS